MECTWHNGKIYFWRNFTENHHGILLLKNWWMHQTIQSLLLMVAIYNHNYISWYSTISIHIPLNPSDLPIMSPKKSALKVSGEAMTFLSIPITPSISREKLHRFQWIHPHGQPMELRKCLPFEVQILSSMEGILQVPDDVIMSCEWTFLNGGDEATIFFPLLLTFFFFF